MFGKRGNSDRIIMVAIVVLLALVVVMAVSGYIRLGPNVEPQECGGLSCAEEACWGKNVDDNCLTNSDTAGKCLARQKCGFGFASDWKCKCRVPASEGIVSPDPRPVPGG